MEAAGSSTITMLSPSQSLKYPSKTLVPKSLGVEYLQAVYHRGMVRIVDAHSTTERTVWRLPASVELDFETSCVGSACPAYELC